MSLINDLRSSDNPITVVDSITPYEPLFLTVIKRGRKFLMSFDTLHLEIMTCKRKTGIEFHQWLKNNDLKIEEAKVKDHYIIFK